MTRWSSIFKWPFPPEMEGRGYSPQTLNLPHIATRGPGFFSTIQQHAKQVKVWLCTLSYSRNSTHMSRDGCLTLLRNQEKNPSVSINLKIRDYSPQKSYRVLTLTFEHRPITDSVGDFLSSFFAGLGMETRALQTLSTCSSEVLHPQPCKWHWRSKPVGAPDESCYTSDWGSSFSACCCIFFLLGTGTNTTPVGLPPVPSAYRRVTWSRLWEADLGQVKTVLPQWKGEQW